MEVKKSPTKKAEPKCQDVKKEAPWQSRRCKPPFPATELEMEPMEQILEVIRSLQANQIAQSRVLRAIISTHPDPDALRAAWRNFSVPSVVEAELAKVSDPARVAVHGDLLDALQAWTERLERDLPAP